MERSNIMSIPYFKNGCRPIRAPYFVNIIPSAKIPKLKEFCEPQSRITRAKTEFWKYYGIKPSFVKLPICPELEARSWLQKTESEKPNRTARRMSLAGGGLYFVNNQVRETGTDFLTRLTATSTSTENSAPNVVLAANGNSNDNAAIDNSGAGSNDLTSIADNVATTSAQSDRTENNTIPNILQIRNHFNPFGRLSNTPFRRRAQSLSSAIPRLAVGKPEERIDFHQNLYPYPNEEYYRLRRSSSNINIMDSITESTAETNEIIPNPIVEPNVVPIDEPMVMDEQIDPPTDGPLNDSPMAVVQPIDEPMAMVKQIDRLTDEPLNNNPMAVVQPIDEPMAMVEQIDQSTDEPLNNNQMAIDNPIDENQHAMRAVAKWVSRSAIW